MSKNIWSSGQKQFKPTKDGIMFDSQFESGNLQSVVSLPMGYQCDGFPPAEYTFGLFVATDPKQDGPVKNMRGSCFDGKELRGWFYFRIKGVKAGETVRFVLLNSKTHEIAFKNGLRPVF